MPAYIRIIANENDEVVYKISSKYKEVTFTDDTIEFTPPRNTFEISINPKQYTLKLDEGVAMPLEGEGCGSKAAEGKITFKRKMVF